jgi:hypothetical protein
MDKEPLLLFLQVGVNNIQTAKLLVPAKFQKIILHICIMGNGPAAVADHHSLFGNINTPE